MWRKSRPVERKAITTNVNNTMNQWGLKETTLKTHMTKSQHGFGFATDWLRRWREFFKPITERRKAKPKQFSDDFWWHHKGKKCIAGCASTVLAIGNTNLPESTCLIPCFLFRTNFVTIDRVNKTLRISEFENSSNYSLAIKS